MSALPVPSTGSLSSVQTSAGIKIGKSREDAGIGERRVDLLVSFWTMSAGVPLGAAMLLHDVAS